MTLNEMDCRKNNHKKIELEIFTIFFWAKDEAETGGLGGCRGSGSDPDSIVFCRPSKQFSMKFLNRSKLTIWYEKKNSETQNISKFFFAA